MEEQTRDRILILLAHPALQKSRVNHRLWQAVQDLEDVTLHDLYEAYPEFDIDVSHEQRLLESHQTVIFQFPFFWYSPPAILKEWQDLVLEHGWAYGREGRALIGKKLLCAISTGGGEDAYLPEGYNGHTLAQLLAPLAQTAKSCGMTWLPPAAFHGTHFMPQPVLDAHAEDYRRLVAGLRDNLVPPGALRGLSRLNEDISLLLGRVPGGSA